MRIDSTCVETVERDKERRPVPPHKRSRPKYPGAQSQWMHRVWVNRGEIGVTASCHRIHSHSLIQTESVSQFQNCAVDTRSERKEGIDDQTDTEAERETQNGYSGGLAKERELTLAQVRGKPWQKGQSNCRCPSGPGSWPAAHGQSGFPGACHSWSGAEGKQAHGDERERERET